MAHSYALVTGASGGIGLDLARLLARGGHPLILVARDAAKLESAAAAFRAEHGLDVQCLAADLSDADAPETLYRATRERGLDIGILVNNAGAGMHGAFASLDAAAQQRMIQLNVAAPTALARLYLPAMLERRAGRILNVASTAAFAPGPRMAVYFATKAYLLSWGEALAYELRGSGVTVTTLCPGPTRTQFDAAAGAGRARMFNSPLVMESGDVARIGYEAMLRGQPVAVAGLANKITANAARFVPRGVAVSVSSMMTGGEK